VCIPTSSETWEIEYKAGECGSRLACPFSSVQARRVGVATAFRRGEESNTYSISQNGGNAKVLSPESGISDDPDCHEGSR